MHLWGFESEVGTNAQPSDQNETKSGITHKYYNKKQKIIQVEYCLLLRNNI